MQALVCSIALILLYYCWLTLANLLEQDSESSVQGPAEWHLGGLLPALNRPRVHDHNEGGDRRYCKTPRLDLIAPHDRDLCKETPKSLAAEPLHVEARHCKLMIHQAVHESLPNPHLPSRIESLRLATSTSSPPSPVRG